ncbi:MAG: peptidoglycan DD-metalloendopeptidase family protein [Acidobacteria bacterium]|nr:peptidoglycan DD-metalloendopeptidase family protein [Acidobacteriota bacterium]
MKLFKIIILVTFTVFCTIIFAKTFFLNIDKAQIANLNGNSNLSDFDDTTDFILPTLDEKVGKNDSIFSILTRAGFNSLVVNQSVQYISDLKERIPVIAGKLYSLSTDGDNAYRLYLDTGNDKILELIYENGKIKHRIIPKPFEYKTKIASIKIHHSLYESFIDNDLSITLAYELANIFSWDIDFNTEIRDGDSLKVIYETAVYKDSPERISRIIAANFNLHGTEYHAYGFIDFDGKINYYDLNGKSLRKAFLKSPLKFRRISSKFTYKRFHPILRKYRPHLGVDYAAAAGTPVHATADGTIIMKGWDKNGGGNALKIRHTNGYITTYMHLKAYARGIRVGGKIQQSALIGYVGSTGLSTGPHLDYRVQHNKKYINPLNLPVLRTASLEPGLKEQFVFFTNRVQNMFSSTNFTQSNNIEFSF